MENGFENEREVESVDTSGIPQAIEPPIPPSLSTDTEYVPPTQTYGQPIPQPPEYGQTPQTYGQPVPPQPSGISILSAQTSFVQDSNMPYGYGQPMPPQYGQQPSGQRYIPPYGAPQSPPKNNNKAALIIVIVGAVLVLIAIIFLAISAGKSVKNIMENGMGTIDLPTYNNQPYDYGNNDGYTEEEYSLYKDDYDKDENIPRKDFKGDYYEHFCNSIDTSLSYDVTIEETTSGDSNTTIYYALTSGLSNTETVNRIIKDEAMVWKDMFDYNLDFSVDSELVIYSYVTYNTENLISIVMDIRANIEGTPYFFLDAVNVDIKNSKLIDEKKWFIIDTVFAEDFVKRSEKQNGKSAILEDFSTAQILEYMSDSEYFIAFYTPLGVEIGINNDYGWVTATYKDYEKYMFPGAQELK